MNAIALDDFTRGYIEAALWSSMDDNDDYLDANYSADDLDAEALDQIVRDCWSFQQENSEYLAMYYERMGRGSDWAGHDFWLTRNGHGAGFWDRGLGLLGDKLTERAEQYGGCYLYPGDDNHLYLSPA